MTSVEVMTACENVCRDFVWLFDGLNNVANNPVWALVLGGIISVFLWRSQTTLSHSLDLRREKRELFRAYISQIGKAVKVIEEVRTEDVLLHPDVRKLWALQSEISLIASESANISSRRVRDAVEKRSSIKANLIASRDGEYRTLDGNVIWETDQMVEVLKQELGRE
ncbi:hypothetical protein [Pseudophaeobacter sp.]|uniref:hypothetical protein n=1 Tax=Pseudophaeobacter sp. TaxID=1971739 RepID=UPI0032970CC5